MEGAKGLFCTLQSVTKTSRLSNDDFDGVAWLWCTRLIHSWERFDVYPLACTTQRRSISLKHGDRGHDLRELEREIHRTTQEEYVSQVQSGNR